MMIAFIGVMGCAVSSHHYECGLKYPYIASSERQIQIREGMTKIKAGMMTSDVMSILGKPDEINELYDRIKNPHTIGYTWWYILERQTESGSVNDKAEKLVRVSFNLKNRVTRVDSWGMVKSDNKPSDRTR